MATITPAALGKLLSEKSGIPLIDVRTPSEFNEVHAESAESFPLDSLQPANFPTDGPIYILCQSGQRATKAAQQFQKSGHHPIVVEGGTLAWIAAGLPVIRGPRQVISLERQIRIAAGSIVFIGFLLGWFINHNFFIIPGFIGLALVVTGISGWCGMGILLSKAPWNR